MQKKKKIPTLRNLCLSTVNWDSVNIQSLISGKTGWDVDCQLTVLGLFDYHCIFHSENWFKNQEKQDGQP